MPITISSASTGETIARLVQRKGADEADAAAGLEIAIDGFPHSGNRLFGLPLLMALIDAPS